MGVSLLGHAWAFLKNDSWFPRVSILKEDSRSTWHIFYLTSGSCGVTSLLVEAVKKGYLSLGGEDTDSTTQWEDCQGQFVRSTYGMRDIVAAVCHNTLARKSWMVFQSWPLIGEVRKRRWKGILCAQKEKRWSHGPEQEEKVLQHLHLFHKQFYCQDCSLIFLAWFLH